MAATFKFYTDAGLTTQFTGTLNFTQAADGSSGPQDLTLWIGSTTASRKLENNASPGTGQITVSIIDANAGTGEPTTAVKLATTQGGLATATAGAALNLGTQLLSSAAQAVWIRVTDATAAVGTYLDLSIQTNQLRESAV